MSTAQFRGTPRRRYYTGGDLARMISIADLRARAHERLPRIALEYLEGGASEEATLARERSVFAGWRFVPHTLVDESHRGTAYPILGREAAMPVIVAPTGLNGLFQRHADTALAQAAAKSNVPFVQGTMSNDRLEDVAKVPGLRHWWQLYVFGPDEIWHSLVDRAAAAGCEALVLTTNAQIFGQREWDSRLRMNRTTPSLPTIIDAALHPGWLVRTLAHGMPEFSNVIDFIPKDRRSFFSSAFWIREQMPKSLSWGTVAKIRQRWKGAFFLKGLLHPDDIRRACDSGVDGIMLGTHGGRQIDWAVSALDVLPRAREIVGDRLALYMSGGIRRGTDVLKALALGADAVLSGRAVLYGLGAAGAPGSCAGARNPARRDRQRAGAAGRAVARQALAGHSGARGRIAPSDGFGTHRLAIGYQDEGEITEKGATGGDAAWRRRSANFSGSGSISGACAGCSAIPETASTG